MAVYLDDVREMKLNKTPFYLPINEEDKRRSSAIFLLTPDVKSSIAMMNHPLTINKNLFTSYYLEKDINFIINESKVMVPTDSSSILESCIMEMTAKERNALPDSAFGLPEDRKYPLDTAEHVKSAIKLFSHCEEDKKSKLAKRIMAAAKRFNIEVAENTEVYKYAHGSVREMVLEGVNVAMTFYHGSDRKLTTLKPISPNMGNKIEGPKWVTYIFKDKERAKLFAVQKVVRNTTKFKKPVYDIYTGKSLLLADQYNDIKKEAVGKKAYLYTTKCNISSLGVGHASSIPEFTSKDEMKIIHTEVINITSAVFDDAFESASPEEIDNAKRSALNDNNRGLLSLIMNPQDEVFEREMYVKKKMKAGEIKPGDNLAIILDDYNKQESTPLSEQVLDYDNYDEERITEEALIYTESGHNFKQFFPDFVENYVTEASGFGGTLRRLLYNERIKNQKECSIIYDRIKEGCPFIKYTYLNYKKYKSRNLFIDWAYYTESFFKNNVYKLDKGIDLYFNFLNKFLQDTRLNEFYKRKTVFIPVDAWYNGKDAVWDYTKSINPISLIYRIFRTKRDDEIKSAWKDIEFVFFSNGVYFKMKFDDFSMAKLSNFNMLINKLCLNSVQDAEFVAKDSTKVITHKIVDKIEKIGIVIDNLSGGAGSGSTKEDIAKEKNSNDFNSATYAKKANTSKEDVDKALLVQKVQTAAEKSGDEDDAMTNLNNDVDSAWMKNLIVDLQSEDGPAINKARSQRMEKAYNSFLGKKINNSKIEDLIKVNGTNQALPKDNIPIESINEEWKDVQFSTFSKSYNLESDIVNSLAALNNKTNPIVILDIIKEDTSTTEDYIETWTIKCEDINGKRFTLKLDIPKFINDRFMKLRGNLKVLNGQLLLLPIIKTDEDTCQIVSSSYNKIFVRRVNPSNGTKTTKSMSVINKYLKKYDGNKMKIIEGDNSIVCSKYDIPIEMRDIASNYNKVIFKDGSYLCFNMDELTSLPYMNPKDKDDPTMTPYYVNDKGKVVCSNAGNFGADIMSIIISHMGLDCFDGIKADKRLSYSEASILATGIPVIVVMAYSEGLQQAMAKAGVESEFRETRPKANESYIKFSDGYIVYPDTTANSLLMSGLYTCNTEDYSIKDINNKNMWLDFLDNFGGRIKADGLDNFYDCMFDPITKEICNTYNLPDDYITALGYASALLGDTKYNLHTDISGNRIRTNEIIAAYFDKVISKAYGEYRIMLKRNKKDATMSVKQSAVIDAVLMDSTCSDLSVLNPQLEAEEANTLSFKGLSGMNSDRSYSLDKRIYNPSMFGVVASSTGFAANVGITRQATINASVEGVRGMIKTPKDVNTLNALSIHEALNPGCTVHDDPIRVAMGFIQSTKHPMRIKKSMPNLITTGMDEAIPYMTSDLFCATFKGKKGKVLDVTDRYLIYEDSDTKERKFINLSEQTMKNSDGGFYVTLKLDPKVKKGQILHNNDILAYDSTCYKKPVGLEKNTKNMAYAIGAMCKLAILPTDEGYEDSSIIDEYLSDAMSSTYVVKKEKILSKDANVYNLVQKGSTINEGDPLMVFQNAFEEEDANALLRSITDDDVEAVSDLGRIHLRSKLSGWVQDIKIYRTCELEDLSPSLRKICKAYEAQIKKDKAMFAKNKIEGAKYLLEPDYKLETNGKLKKAQDSVLIEFYLKCEDKMGVGDKLIYNNSIKGVVKDIMPKGDEPRTEFRPDEPVDALLATSSVNARMVSSIIITGAINKALVELDRKCKEMLGIKWKNLDQM